MSKIIAMMPVRNEAWVLRHSLAALAAVCDIILVANQRSEDETRHICRSEPKAVLLDNPTSGHSNVVRWTLLDAARGYDGNNLLLALDADELISPPLLRGYVPCVFDSLRPGSWIYMHWVQLWRSPGVYRDDGSVWANLWKPMAFLDDRKMDYDRTRVVINDHTARVPGRPATPGVRAEGVPVLHLQWAFWERAQQKQAWYRCRELVAGEPPRHINARYAPTLDDRSAAVRLVPSEWLEALTFPSDAEVNRSAWYLDEIRNLFDEHGSIFFEPLQIWHIPQLASEFARRVGRPPQPRPSLVERVLAVPGVQPLAQAWRFLREYRTHG